jgi:hypothetical protein
MFLNLKQNKCSVDATRKALSSDKSKQLDESTRKQLAEVYFLCLSFYKNAGFQHFFDRHGKHCHQLLKKQRSEQFRHRYVKQGAFF